MKQGNHPRRRYTTSARSNKARAENWALFQIKAAEGNVRRALYDLMRETDNVTIRDATLYTKLSLVERQINGLLTQAYSVVTEIQSERLSKQTKKD